MPATTFLYDDACPMCQAYTAAFHRLGVSDRRAFSEVEQDDYPLLDWRRGRHEIPMVDGETGEVHYGLDAMTLALGKSVPWLRWLLRSRLLSVALTPVYQIITYNRRVIAGTKAPLQGFDCAPDYHVGWRWTYIGIASAAVLGFGIPAAPALIFLGLALLIGLVLAQQKLHFLGQLLTVAVAFSALNALFPSDLGLASAYIVAGLELGRRW